MVSIGILRPRAALAVAALVLCGLKIVTSIYDCCIIVKPPADCISVDWFVWPLCRNEKPCDGAAEWLRLL